MSNHKELKAWKRAMGLAKEIYTLSDTFPQREQFGLTAQIRRAVISIPSNIAEGSARNYDKEFIQFLYIALGSLAEVETQLLLAREFGYFEGMTIFNRLEDTKRPLLGLIKYVKGKG
jgi:four helix bundle protein